MSPNSVVRDAAGNMVSTGVPGINCSGLEACPWRTPQALRSAIR